MKNIFIVLSSFMSLCLLNSCVKDLQLYLPEENPKITVNALFSNQTYWEVELISSASVNKQSITSYYFINDSVLFNHIENAEVLIYEDDVFLTKLYYMGKGIYIDSLLYPKPGKSYTLKVSAPGYPSVTATEKLPEKLIYNYKNISSDSAVSNVNPFYFNFSIQKPNEKSYYLSQIHKLTVKNLGNGAYDSIEDYRRYKFPALAKDFVEYRAFTLFSDENFPNTQDVEFHVNFGVYKKKSNFSIEEYKCFNFGRCSPIFYNYLKDLNNYYISDNNFLDEPTGIYSNIEGGYGIFAGVSITTDTLYYFKR